VNVNVRVVAADHLNCAATHGPSRRTSRKEVEALDEIVEVAVAQRQGTARADRVDADEDDSLVAGGHGNVYVHVYDYDHARSITITITITPTITRNRGET
jgi:hypothetical protein